MNEAAFCNLIRHNFMLCIFCHDRLKKHFLHFQESSFKALTQGGGRMDTALDLLHRQHALDVANHEVVNGLASVVRTASTSASGPLTARNVAMMSMAPSGNPSSRKPSSESAASIHRANPVNPVVVTPTNTNGAPPALPPRYHITSCLCFLIFIVFLYIYRSIHMEPPRVPSHTSTAPPGAGPSLEHAPHQVVTRKYSPNQHPPPTINGNGETPPPPPPPRGAPNPPPTPPRGATPPPNVLAAAVVTSSALSNPYSNTTTSLPPQLLKRMSPVPGHASRAHQGGVAVSSAASQRGTSPVTTAGNPMKVHNTREIQQQLQQQLQSIQSCSIFPADSVGAEPPPPYPMGTAVSTGAPPPPSYSQSLAMRQSPTLSSTSSDYRYMNGSDYRRSPAPNATPIANSGHAHLIGSAYPTYQQQPISPSPSPSVSSLSSRTSSMQACAARQAKTQSPVIVQSVRSTQVQKPVLQTATGIAEGVIKGVALPVKAVVTTTGPAVVAAPPPPSYEISIQQKQQQHSQVLVTRPAQPTPSTSPMTVTHSHHNSPVTVPRTLSPSGVGVALPDKGQQLPPPPPYPSSAVKTAAASINNGENNLVNGTSVQAKQQPVISTAKVVSASGGSNLNKPVLQRKYSPLTPETTSSSASRSESPISDSQQTTISSSDNTVSYSPLSFNNANNLNNASEVTLTATDSGIGDNSTASSSLMPPPPVPPHPGKTTHHTSPKPERKNLSPAKEEVRKSYIKKCPPEAYKFYMEQHIEKIMKEFDERRRRRERFNNELEETESFGQFLKEDYVKFMQKLESNYLRMKRAKLNKNDFEKMKSIGVGAFGEVSLVRKKGLKDSEPYAMKTLKKSHVKKKKQVAHVIAEKDILAEANNDWIVKLHYSFQVYRNEVLSKVKNHVLNDCFNFRTRTTFTLSWSTSPVVTSCPSSSRKKSSLKTWQGKQCSRIMNAST